MNTDAWNVEDMNIIEKCLLLFCFVDSNDISDSASVSESILSFSKMKLSVCCANKTGRPVLSSINYQISNLEKTKFYQHYILSKLMVVVEEVGLITCERIVVGKCRTPHSRKRTVYFSPNQPTWKMKNKRMKKTVKSATWRVEENQNNHCAWSVDDMMRRNVLSHVVCDTVMNACRCKKMWRVVEFCSHTPSVAADCYQL